MNSHRSGASHRNAVLLLVGLIALLSIFLPFSASPVAAQDSAYAVAQSQPNVPATPTETTRTISAKALTSHSCDDSEWHFVINQVVDEDHAPASIAVNWANGDSETVELSAFTGHVAHYRTTSNLDSTVTSATADIYGSWHGRFVLSHGPCGGSGTNTPEATNTHEATRTHTAEATQTHGPTNTPGATHTHVPTNTPTNTPAGTGTHEATITRTPGSTGTPQGGCEFSILAFHACMR